jgi:hypothetical protein
LGDDRKIQRGSAENVIDLLLILGLYASQNTMRESRHCNLGKSLLLGKDDLPYYKTDEYQRILPTV